MHKGDRLKHWRSLADGYLESAAVLFRKKRYQEMLHHCYFAVQSALEAAFLARQAYRVQPTVSLVVMAEALQSHWSVPQRELFLGLTEWYRASSGSPESAIGSVHSRDDCLRTLMATAELVGELRDTEK